MLIDLLYIALFLTTSIVLFLLSGGVYLAQRDNRSNWALAGLFFLFSVITLSSGMYIASTNPGSTNFWGVLQAITTYSVGPVIFLVTLQLFRPNLARSRWITWITVALIFAPMVFSLMDIFGFSTFFFESPMLFHPVTPEAIEIGRLNISLFTGGTIFQGFLTAMLVIFSIFFIILSGWIAWAERTRKPRISLMAWGLFAAGLISTFLRMFPLLSNNLTALLQSWTFIIAFGYVLWRSEDSFSMKRILTAVNDLNMFTKLSLGALGLIVPGAVLITLLFLSFTSRTLLNIQIDRLHSVTHSESGLIISTITQQLNNLKSLQSDDILTALIEARQSNYAGQNEDTIFQQLRQAERIWQRLDQQNLFIESILSPTRNSSLREFNTLFPINETIIVVDQYGGLITATDYVENYDFSADELLGVAIVTGQTQISPILQERSALRHINLYIPITLDEDPDEVVAVIISRIRVIDLVQDIDQHVAVSTGGGVGVYNGAGEELSALIRLTDSNFNAPLFTDFPDGSYWQMTSLSNQTVLGVWNHIGKDESIQATGTPLSTDLYIYTYMPLDEVFANLQTAQIAALITILALLAGSVFLTVLLARVITIPLNQLTSAAQRVVEGDRNLKIDVPGKDEIGTLASNFNRMTEELNSLVLSLESTVQERTKAMESRARQLETSAIVAREASEIRDLQQLLDRAAELISERFGYYHCGIFLLDDRQEYAVLQAANSPGGKRMLSRGHKLQIGKVGVVGFTAGMGEPRIAQDVGADVTYYDNPDMPATRSEMALPLTVRDTIIGVLDVQSENPNAFNQEDVQVLELLADQIALAIENARLLESSQRSLEELQYIYGQQVAASWKRRLMAESPEFRYDAVGVTRRAAAQPDIRAAGNRLLSLPIMFRNQTIGEIELLRDENQSAWTEEERTLVDEILEQTALALENARLVDQIRLRSDQIQLLQEITAISATLLNEDELLTQVCEKLRTDLDVLHTGVVLFNEDYTSGYLAANASAPEAPGADMSIGTELPMEGNEVTLDVIRSKQTAVVYDLESNPRVEPFRDVMLSRGTKTLVIIPLIARGNVIGTIGLDVADPERRFDEEDLTLFNQISTQIANALDNTRLFSAEQQGRRAAAALLEITQIASSSLDLRQVLLEVTQLSAAAVEANRCTIFSYDRETDAIVPLMSQFADGHFDEALWEHFRNIPSNKLEEIPFLQRVYRERQPYVLHDVHNPEMIPQVWIDVYHNERILGVPLISQNEVIGFMAFDHITPDKDFSPEQIELAQTIGGQVATTISNVSLFEETVERAERERLVTEITTKVRASNDPQQIVQTAIEELRKALGARQDQVSVKTETRPSNGNGSNPQQQNGNE